MSETKRSFKRVVLKLSGEALREVGSQDNISPEIVERIALEIKEAHAAGSFGIYTICKYKGLSTKNAIHTAVWLGFLKEGIDAMVPWERYGSWGGDGWSNADLMANGLGVGTAWLIDKYWHPKSDIRLSISFYYVR